MLSSSRRPSIIKRALKLTLTLAVGLSFANPTLAATKSAPVASKTVPVAKKEDGGFDTAAPQAILIEASSGSVLFEKNADQLSAPSSMIKLMTMEVVFNALTQGKINLTDEYTVSENAWRKGGAPSGGATMFAAIHSRVKVEDLLRGAIIDNANDACMILAEGMAGSEGSFAAMMTARARELGLTQSTFTNSSGLSDPGNLMSVRELGMLARHIVTAYPDFFKIYNERDYTWNKIAQQNRNALLNSFTEADGFTTGYSKEGGYGMVATAVENGTRLIAAINGMDDADDRIAEAKKILEWGFRNFETRALFQPEQPIGYAEVYGGDSGSVALATHDPVGVMVQKNGNDKLLARIVYTGPVRAPVTAGQPIGIVRVTRNNNVALEMPVYATESVGSGSMTRRAWDSMTESVIALIRIGVQKL